jgi:ABC-type branched-subunit amino acid transport system substrate-binding protein
MAGLLRKVSITGLLWFISSAVMAEYYIGMTAGFTGPQGQDNLAYRYGVEAYFQQINRSGGIKGEEIELEVLDDEFSPDLAERNLMRFVTRKGVLAVLGGDMATAASLALAAQREKVLFLGSLSGHPTLYGNVKSVLNIRPSIAHEAEFLCRQMRTQGIKQATVVSPDESAEHIVALCGEQRVELTTVRYSASTLNF